MNEMEKFVTIFCVICGVYSVYEKCEANPRNGCRGMFFNFVFHEFCFSDEHYHWLVNLWFILWIPLNGDLIELCFRRISQKVENSFAIKGRHKQAFGANVAGCSH